MQSFGSDHGKAAVCIAENKHGVGLYLRHERIRLCNNIAAGLAEIVSYGVEIDLRIFKFQVFKEYAVSVVIVVLSGMREYYVEIFAALGDNCGKAYYLRTRSDNDKQFKFAVVFPLYIFKHYLFSSARRSFI